MPCAPWSTYARPDLRSRVSAKRGSRDGRCRPSMDLRGLLYGTYERRLAAELTPERVPRHVGVILDGNRRWAKALGVGVASGHRKGAAKIDEFLSWCSELQIEVVTLWLLSTDNLNRPDEELAPLLRIIENAVAELAVGRRWRINPVGALDLLPDNRCSPDVRITRSGSG